MMSSVHMKFIFVLIYTHSCLRFNILIVLAISPGDGVSAMKVLNKSNDLKFQYYACVLALNNPNMSNTGGDMLNNCFKRSLEKVPLNNAKEVVSAHPQLKHFALWYHGRQRSSEMLENDSVLSSWLTEKEDKRNILEKISDDVKELDISSSDVDVLKNLVNICEGMDKAKVLVYTSGHLAIASISSSVERLKHILLALKVAYKMHSRMFLFPTLFSAALYSNGPLESYPLLNKAGSDNSDYTRSIRAFFCDSIVNWLYYCTNINLDQGKMFDILEKTVENYIEDVVSMDTVQYFKAQNSIAALETALCQQLVKNNIVKKVDSVENLSLFKNIEKNKVQNGEQNDELSTQTKSENQSEEEKKANDETLIEEVKKMGDDKLVEEEKAKDGELIEGEKSKDTELVKEKAVVEEGKDNAENEMKKTEIFDRNTRDTDDVNEGSKKDEKTIEDCHKSFEVEDKEDTKQIEKSVDALQDFEKASNPEYDAMATQDPEEKESEEFQTPDEKLQRLKELKEIIANFESSRIYSPNPSIVFDLVFKIIKTFDTDQVEGRRIHELVALMNTHAEVFALV